MQHFNKVYFFGNNVSYCIVYVRDSEIKTWIIYLGDLIIL